MVFVGRALSNRPTYASDFFITAYEAASAGALVTLARTTPE